MSNNVLTLYIKPVQQKEQTEYQDFVKGNFAVDQSLLEVKVKRTIFLAPRHVIHDMYALLERSKQLKSSNRVFLYWADFQI